MRLIILVLTLIPLATAQENGLTVGEILEHIDVIETNIMSTQELNITILFGWLTASYLVAQKLTRKQFLLASLSYSAVTLTLIFQITFMSIHAIGFMGEVGFYIFKESSDYWIVGWRAGLAMLLYIVSMYFAFSVRRGKNQTEIAID